MTRFAARAIVLASVLWCVVYLFFPEQHHHLLSAVEGTIALFGGLSSVAVAMALTFWVAKRVSVRLGKRGFEDFSLARRWVGFLRAHHVIFGWAAFAAATAHALYFLYDSPRLSAHAVTGWAAWGLLAVLVAAGLLLRRALWAGSDSEMSRDARARRRIHGVLAALFVVAFSFHTAFPATVLVLWVFLAIPTALVWRNKKAHRSISNQEAGSGSPHEGSAEEARTRRRERR